MKAGKYSIKELFVNRYVDQVVIPEIQRDYVWKKEQVTGLFYSIYSDFLKFQDCKENVPKIETTDEDLTRAFEEFFQKRHFSSNIGFIYAYNDDQSAGKYFLIDGQQRITTIFLLLLALTSDEEDLKKDFKSTYFEDNILKVDYKVREAAHQFLSAFVESKLKDMADIKDASWYFKNQYDSDTTIQSILKNFTTLKNLIGTQENLNKKSLYSYLENYVSFWYFDTNVSEQGEELYIYMNARGEQIQGNENIKADLLGRLNSHGNQEDLKKDYGARWEDWQDFFWQNRGENENADPGFNEFLSCISGLEKLLEYSTENFYSKEKFEEHGQIRTSDLLKNLEIHKIEKYLNALQFIANEKEEFQKGYSYSNWVDKCFNEILRIFNKEKTNWYADYNDSNRATERNRMVFIWSILYYTVNCPSNEQKRDNVFRLLRRFYLRYSNFDRSVKSIKPTVKQILEKGVFETLETTSSQEGETEEDVLTSTNNLGEENAKSKIFSQYLKDSVILRKFEEAIWKIEDHKFNLEGRGVGGTNISHLIELKENVSLLELDIVHKKFFEVFPARDKEYHTVQNILLFFGKYWHRVTPYYYENYQFDNWKRIIRDYTGDETKRTTFKNFFKEFLQFSGSFTEFASEKSVQKILTEEATDLRRQLIWYYQALGNRMWSEGNFIALKDWEGPDLVFPNTHKIRNTKGNFKGGNPTSLFSRLPRKIKGEISNQEELVKAE